MAKPTLIQSLLGRPSQTYSFPVEKQYHSEKHRLSVIAVTTESSLPPTPNEEPYQEYAEEQEEMREEEQVETSSDSDDDVFFTPLSSPRVSVVSTSTPRRLSLNVDYLTQNLPQASISDISLDSTLATVSADDHASTFSSPSVSTHMTTPQSSEPGCSTATPNYEREAWAKDVRWLVPPTPHREKHAHLKRRHTTKVTPSFTTSMLSVTELDEGETSEVRSSKGAHHPARSASVSVTLSSGSRTEPKPKEKHRRAHSVSSHASYRTAETSTPYTDTLSTQYLPSNGTAGYSSLVLPRAPPVASTSPSLDTKLTKVDLTKTGMAHTTMASVEVVQGLSSASSTPKWFGKIKRKKPPLAASALGFTHHRLPPSNVPGNSVLVQIWAVAMDKVDATLCANAELGYIPGRSVVGRAVEIGWEVAEGMVRKGDWVIALADVRTAGALTEFIVVDRRRLYRVPHPNTPPPIVFGGLEQVSEESETDSPSEETRSSSKHDGRYPHPSSSSLPPKPPLSRSSSSHRRRRTQGPDFGYRLEELALLPLCGIPAYRAVRTLTSNVNSNSITGASQRKKALVLKGDTGAGAMVTQMLCRRGWRVVIHSYLVDDSDADRTEAFTRTNAQLWGAEEVIFGDAVETIELCTKQRDLFDAVVDDIGGKAIREASYRLLDISRQKGTTNLFTTMVGGHPERVVPTSTDLFRAAQRSRDGGSRGVAYAWVNVAQDMDWEGQDVSETLACVLKEGVKPLIKTEDTTTLDRAPDAFAKSRLKGGGVLVVRVAT